MHPLLQLLRPKQWIKNFFVLAPLFFSSGFFDLHRLSLALAATAAFCFASSAVYCLNDLIDCKADRAHPVKCYRPIASGAVSIGQALGLLALCMIVAVAISLIVHSRGLLITIVVYWILNLAYCLWLKQIAIVDIICISVGFVMRVVAGGVVADIWVSQWLVLMVFLLAAFLALTKRADELSVGGDLSSRRVSMSGYNAPFIRTATAVIASTTLVCYIMYTMSSEVIMRMHTPNLYITTIWVLAGMLRYLQIMMVFKNSGSPTNTFLSDKFIRICLAGWLVSYALILYVF